MTTSDRIEKQITLKASRARVWRALTDAKEFGAWFGAALTTPFREGVAAKGKITSRGYEHVTMEFIIETIEPETFFSFRWHPNAIEPGVDYSGEPTTLVEFRLEDAPGGTKLTVVESGFERIPEARRTVAFPRNDRGWSIQMENIARHVAG